jgi:hypothetical protein
MTSIDTYIAPIGGHPTHPVVASTLRPALLLSSQNRKSPSGRFRVYIMQCGVENFVSGLGFFVRSVTTATRLCSYCVVNVKPLMQF